MQAPIAAAPYVRPVAAASLAAVLLAVALPCQEPEVAAAERPAPVRVACVGDSITFGAGIEAREQNCYPVVLQRLLGDRYAVRNFGVSGATMLAAGNKPWRGQPAFTAATEFDPHVVVLCLGTNDSKPPNWQHGDAFAGDAQRLIEHFAALPARPMVWLCLPPPAARDRWGIHEATLIGDVRPRLVALAAKLGLPTIDLHRPLRDKPERMPDGIHPDAAGAALLAAAVRDAVFGGAHRVPRDLPAGFRPVLVEEFAADDAAAAYWFTDPAAWRVERDESRRYLELFGKSRYRYEVRSPLNIALRKDLELESFVLDVELLQTGREYGHRDLCLFFGFRDRNHFYYAHIATKGDPHAHKIFAVDGEPRRSIADFATPGYDWGKQVWKHVRLVRDARSGRIALYADDMVKPIMTAIDRRFERGRIGFGSFDDTGRIASVRVYAPRALPAAAGARDPFAAGRR